MLAIDVGMVWYIEFTFKLLILLILDILQGVLSIIPWDYDFNKNKDYGGLFIRYLRILIENLRPKSKEGRNQRY